MKTVNYGYVYMTTNLVNGHMYIGKHHASEFDANYYGSGKLIVRALQKYGKDSFVIDIISWHKTKTELNLAEQLTIAAFNAVESPMFYNISKGGDGGDLCSTYSKQERSDMTKRAWQTLHANGTYEQRNKRAGLSIAAVIASKTPEQLAISASKRWQTIVEHGTATDIYAKASTSCHNRSLDDAMLISGKYSHARKANSAARNRQIGKKAWQTIRQHINERNAKLAMTHKQRKQFIVKYGTAIVYKYKGKIDKFEPFMHFIIVDSLVTVFVWDTRQVLFQCQESELPNKLYCKARDSYLPLVYADNTISKEDQE